MNLRELKTFVTIVRYGSFNKAATALDYTPTSVTNQIHNLENDLGVVLFDRGKQVKLTPVGKMLYDEGVSLLDLEQRVEEHIKDYDIGIRGSVAIGAVQPFLDCYGPEFLKALADAYPTVSVSLSGGYSEELGRKLKEGQIDLLISGKKTYRNYVFSVTPICSYNNNLLVFSENHKFKDYPTLNISDLNGERIMMGPENSYFSDLFALSLKEYGCVNFKRTVFDQVQNIYPFIESGYMVSILPNTPGNLKLMRQYKIASKELSDYSEIKYVNLLTNEPYSPLSAAQKNVKNFILKYARQILNDKDHANFTW